jgi:antitoxin FitA
MFCTCDNVLNMSKMIQVRHVPDDVHRRLKARAAMKGMSLSDFLRTELELIAERALVEEVLEAAESDAVVSPASFARVWDEVRAERDR